VYLTHSVEITKLGRLPVCDKNKRETKTNEFEDIEKEKKMSERKKRERVNEREEKERKRKIERGR